MTSTITPTPQPRARRPPPIKKRHTKPCRYYQNGTCPHAAQEDCDFAHVYAPSGLKSSPSPPPKQCRYWLQGVCTNGMWCQFRHGDDQDGVEELRITDYNIQVRSATTPGPEPVGLVPVVPPSPYFGQPSAIYFGPSPYQPHTPMETSPVASPAGSPTSEEEMYAQRPYYYSPYEPALGYSPAAIPSAFMAIPVFDTSMGPRALPLPATPGLSPRTFRPRSASYHTKPCRYFKPGSVCPSGDNCTFIHAYPRVSVSTESDRSPEAPSVRISHEPIAKKDYFPVSWRVIGGGVSLSDNKQPILPPFSDEEDVASDVSQDSASTFEMPSDGPSSNSDHELLVEPSVTSTIDFPSEGEDDTEENDAVLRRTPLKMTIPAVRQRASSGPSTPIGTHLVDVLRLFPAES
ncbi:unnamed protein product [Mycena citricolor]|uniref:C3H1-type domain-containing protein n=1 Tax=Mycena citricolor TaxID=2018698 RepID=A0AAD2GR81_9AGAR|nr:unnamed protein product [Mycena citricolor]